MRLIGARLADTDAGASTDGSPAGEGPSDDLGCLYEAQSPRLRRYFGRRAGRDEALDLVQDSFLRLIGRALPERPEAFLSRIASNLLRDRERRLLRRPATAHVPIEAVAPTPGPDLHRQLEARDMLMRLERAMLRLKPRTREIFMAHRLDGLTYAEIAARTGLSIKAVENQMSIAIARLDDLMGRRL